MLKAIIFDFDGVIADTEPIHLEAFKIILKNNGIDLTDEQYFSKYLAFDDKTLFSQIYEDNGKNVSEVFIRKLIDDKHVIITDLFENHVTVFPGIEDFINKAGKNLILSIASGALRSEIEFILDKYGLKENFQSITSADEVVNCKPDPEPFLKALQKINSESELKIDPSECLVFEDSVYGIQAAKAAGMKCIAITNSYDRSVLEGADLFIDSFSDLTDPMIEGLFINS